MKLAVVVGGWHFPIHFYVSLAYELRGSGADLFVIAHRNPELAVVREEKVEILAKAGGRLGDLDRLMYSTYPSVDCLRKIGFDYREEPNIMGDWCFFNQWLDRNDYRKYDVILNCHDDTFIRNLNLGDRFDVGNWLLLANGRYPEAPEGYVRGSFEFWKRELLDKLGGRIDLGDIELTREGKTDSPQELSALAEWNNTGIPVRDFMVANRISDRIAYLSPYYRVSNHAIECERGFLHMKNGAPWSFEEGLKAFPVE